MEIDKESVESVERFEDGRAVDKDLETGNKEKNELDRPRSHVSRISAKTTEDNEKDAAPVQRVVTAQDWTGPDDPENPFNWSISKRAYNTFCIGLLSFAATFATSVYTPGYHEVSQRFGVSGTAALLGVSMFVLALGVGPVLGAPASEMFGRVVVYRTSTPIFMLFTLGAGFSQTFAQFLVCRFFGGLFAGPVLAVGAGSNSDLWPRSVRAVASSAFLVAPFLGPSLGPAAGGFTAMNKGWRWTQWDILFITLPFYLITLGMSETYKKTILEKRAKRLGIEPPKSNMTAKQMIKVVLIRTIARPVHMLLTEPIVGLVSSYNAFTFAVLFAFFAAFPIVFQGVYHFNPGESGLVFLAVGLGVLLGATSAALADRIFYRKQLRIAEKEGRLVAPEHRLYAAMGGSLGIPIGLFWFAWSSRSSVHWISPVLASVPFAYGNSAIFCSSVLYLIDVYGPMLGASAMAGNGLLRYGLSAGFPLFTVQMYNSLGIDWATSVFGFISLVMLPIPWVFFKYGPQIRAKSKYEVAKE